MKKVILILTIITFAGSITAFYLWNKSEKENLDNYYCTVEGMIDGEWMYDMAITQNDFEDFEENSHYQFDGWYRSEKRILKSFNQECYKGKTMYAKYTPLEMIVDFIETTHVDIEVDKYYSFYDSIVIVSKDERIFTTQEYDLDNTLLVEITEDLELELGETIVNVHFTSKRSRVFETSLGRFIVEDAYKYTQDKRTRVLFDKYTEYDAYAFSNIAFGGYFMFTNDHLVYQDKLGDIFDITTHINNVVNSTEVINAYNTTIGTYFEMLDGSVYSLIPFSDGSPNYHIEQVESVLLGDEIKKGSIKDFYVDNGIIYQRYLSKIALFEFSIPNGIIPDGDTIIEVYGTRSTDSNDTVRIIVRTDNDLYGISRSRTNNEYQYSAFDGTEEYKISSLFNLSDDETVNHILVVRDSTVSYGEYVTIVTTSENRVMMFGSTFRSENFYLPTNSDTEIIDYTDLLDISMDTEILELDYYSGAVSIYINDGSFYRINLKGEPYGFNYKTYMDAIKYIEPSMVTFKQATFTVEDNLLEIAALTLGYDNVTKLYIDSLYTDEMITINPFEERHHYFFVYPE